MKLRKQQTEQQKQIEEEERIKRENEEEKRMEEERRENERREQDEDLSNKRRLKENVMRKLPLGTDRNHNRSKIKLFRVFILKVVELNAIFFVFHSLSFF